MLKHTNGPCLVRYRMLPGTSGVPGICQVPGYLAARKCEELIGYLGMNALTALALSDRLARGYLFDPMDTWPKNVTYCVP